MILERMLSLLFSSPLRTLYAFGCTIVLCVIFQLCFLLRAKKREGQKLSVRHFVRVFILLFYLAMVYKVTGMGTVWIIGRYPELIRMSEIYWIPFLPFEDWSSYLLNVVMTIPLGILLPLIWSEFRSLKKITLTGFLFSLAIELSQLLNRRATATEDLIMNTLGIVVGYLIFRIFYKIFSKKEKLKSESHNSVRDKRKVSSPIVKHEAIWYLVLSFLGMFLFYGSISLSSENHEIEVGDDVIQVKNEDGEIVREYKKIEERFINGELLEITDTTIKVQKNDVYEMEGGGTLVWNTEEEVTILIGETTFEIWRTNTRGTIDPIISIAKVDDLHIGDGIDVHGDYEGERFVAEKIVIWRFDVK